MRASNRSMSRSITVDERDMRVTLILEWAGGCVRVERRCSGSWRIAVDDEKRFLLLFLPSQHEIEGRVGRSEATRPTADFSKNRD